jgi:hypothetical protein
MRELEMMNPSSGSMVDNLIKMVWLCLALQHARLLTCCWIPRQLEKYSQDLEGIVAERTSELAVEKEKVETLVYRMLPKEVVRKLTDGETVKAESFDEVTIFFSGQLPSKAY